jgi:hypothetical protein
VGVHCNPAQNRLQYAWVKFRQYDMKIKLCHVQSFCFVTGNIDQGQYCEKIKNIVDFLGMRLSNEELTTIWKIQVLTLLGASMHFSVAAVTVFFFVD